MNAQLHNPKNKWTSGERDHRNIPPSQKVSIYLFCCSYLISCIAPLFRASVQVLAVWEGTCPEFPVFCSAGNVISNITEPNKAERFSFAVGKFSFVCIMSCEILF